MEAVLDINDDLYPSMLLETRRPPKKLYYKGDIKCIGDRCLAVVGSRKITSYGKEVVRKLIPKFVEEGIVIVSGFMYGVDACAHEWALNANGKTVAVMPCGIELVHPRYQIALYERILEKGGVVISEYPGTQLPEKWSFPQRNRIVAGLSEGVLVIEAAEDSGSLITANYSFENKRKVFAVTGSMFSENSVGTADLVSKGAEAIFSYTQVLDYFSIQPDIQPQLTFNINEQSLGVEDLLNLNQKKVLSMIINDINSPYEISFNTGYTVQVVNSCITELMLNDFIYEKDGSYYAL